jgi:hypothetical protein
MEEPAEKKLMVVAKRKQGKEHHLLFKPEDKHLARNLAVKEEMAAELAGMGLDRKAIARLLNLYRGKEE